MNAKIISLHGISTILLAVASAPARAEGNSTCDVEQTKKELVSMIDRDVHVRLVYLGEIKEAEAKKEGRLTMKEMSDFNERVLEADKENQEELDRIVADCGWPKRDVLGKESVRIAAMIMVHAPPEFAHKHMGQMMASYKAGETFPLWMATVIDDDLIAQGKPQLYGTRGDALNLDGRKAIVEDPEHLEERRRAFGIPAVIPWDE